MKITFERSGGFAGITMRGSVDTTQLPTDEAEEVEGLVRNADLPTLAARPASTTPSAPDRFQYYLTVSADDETRHLEIAEHELTPQLRALLDRLTEHARGS